MMIDCERRLSEVEDDAMSEEGVVGTREIRSVLHPTDFSESSRLAFAHALRMALSGHTKMYVLHADPEASDEPDWSMFPGVRRTLADWGLIEQGSSPRAVFDDLGVRLAKIRVQDRDAVRAILRFLAEHPSDIIVLATHGRDGLPRWLHGSVAEPVARAGHTNTLFIPHGARGFVAPENGVVTLRRILVPVDRRPAPGPALDAAAQIVRLLADAPVALELLYVGDAGDMPSLQFDQASWSTVERTIRSGDVVAQILAAAERGAADLIVMATEGHQGFLDAIRGSTTERVLRQAPCPLLTVPAL
jgi:nucleotide-binding universal stress UspA family protein